MQTLHVKTSLSTRDNGILILTDTFNGSRKVSEIIGMITGRSYNEVMEIRIERINYDV